MHDINIMTLQLLYWIFGALLLTRSSLGAVLAPPWADPKINPCASKPRGWQMLYWPEDGNCYKIFKMGHPCPLSMELAPGSNGAECKCPPKTLRLYNDTECYPMFSKGPCSQGEYLAPNTTKEGSESRFGLCVKQKNCPDPTQLSWPQDNRCYRRLTRGPCSPGELLTIGNDGVPECNCSGNGEMREHVWEIDSRCYEHYSKGPCTTGQLFLPGGKCGCTPDLPHYHKHDSSCYEIGSIGPCQKGQRFSLSTEINTRAQCRCKPDNIKWQDGSCYRVYTRGPCEIGEILTPSAKCSPIPCRRSRLYFPEQKRCYKIGTQGPCKEGQVVLFDFESRPSVDGIAYNGICGCAGALSIEDSSDCTLEKMADNDCGSSPGMVVIDNKCHMLYTRGPCENGQWLIPKNENSTERAACACKPGFTKQDPDKNSDMKDSCLPPSVSLARYLNIKFSRNRTKN